MLGHADDTLLYCIAAAGFVVLAHGVDAIMPRRRRTGGNPLALALLALGVVALAVGGLFAKSSTDVLAVLASAAAVVVSALPLTGVLDRDEEQPPNPWDRAYHVHRDRVAHLLGVRPADRPAPDDVAPTVGTRTGATAADAAPGARRSDRPGPGATPQVPRTGATQSPRTPHHGVVVTPAEASAPASTPEVYEAEETLQDVSQVVGDLGRLLGLDRRPRHDR